jgi:hypothetical protein
MATIEKLTPDEVRNIVAPLVVCAYEDEAKCDRVRIQGALSLNEFRSRLPDIPKDERIVFY